MKMRTRLELPFTSTGLVGSVRFNKMPARVCSLEMSYVNDDEQTLTLEIIFRGVEAFRSHLGYSISSELIDAYDRLVEVVDSRWLDEIRKNFRDYGLESPLFLHLAIYFDGGPAYELICIDFEARNVE